MAKKEVRGEGGGGVWTIAALMPECFRGGKQGTHVFNFLLGAAFQQLGDVWVRLATNLGSCYFWP